MTTDTAVHNIERYVLMLERGASTKAARKRYNMAMGHMKEVANYMFYGHYAEWGILEDMKKREEEKTGADLTSMMEVVKRRNKACQDS